MGEIIEAIEKFDQRKAALRIEPEGTIAADNDTARLMLSGFDIDLEELNVARVAAAESARLAVNEKMENGGDATQVIGTEFASLWVDGFVTGMLMQKGRENED